MKTSTIETKPPTTTVSRDDHCQKLTRHRLCRLLGCFEFLNNRLQRHRAHHLNLES